MTPFFSNERLIGGEKKKKKESCLEKIRVDRLSTGFAISRPFRRLPLERERSRRPFINISRQRGALSPRERRERRAYQSAGSTEKSRRAAIIFNPALNIDADTWQEGTFNRRSGIVRVAVIPTRANDHQPTDLVTQNPTIFTIDAIRDERPIIRNWVGV